MQVMVESLMLRGSKLRTRGGDRTAAFGSRLLTPGTRSVAGMDVSNARTVENIIK